MLDLTLPFRAYARIRSRKLAAQNPVETQRQQLHQLLAKAKDTHFGHANRFAHIHRVEDYQDRVRIRRYEDFWREYWQPVFPRLDNCTWPGTIPYFALTSGTTSGVTKYIPVSPEMIASNRVAGLDIVTHHYAARPGSTLMRGLCFMLGGSTALTQLAPGIWGGDLSGIAGKTVPWWVRLRYFPPRELETIADWEEKITRFGPASLASDIRAVGGVPSWLLLFFDKLAELRPDCDRRLAGIYPDLEMLVHGGVNFAPYRSHFARWLEGSRAETREIYPASEGCIAIADRGDGEGLRLITDTGIFYEFVPLEELDSPNPTRHWLETVELGVNYAIVLTTCAGLWSYVIGDTVRFIDRNPPRLLVTGRTSYFLSAFGEHLIGEEIERAVAEAAMEVNALVKDYSVGALFAEAAGEVGGHLYIVEFVEGVLVDERLHHFAMAIDAALCRVNEDYKAHRAEGFGMRAPRVHAVPPNTFTAWMKSRGRLGGQNKVPRIISDTSLFASLRQFTGCA